MSVRMLVALTADESVYGKPVALTEFLESVRPVVFGAFLEAEN